MLYLHYDFSTKILIIVKLLNINCIYWWHLKDKFYSDPHFPVVLALSIIKNRGRYV
ncbi:protein of unknown function [Legionella longbeachae NSW150]|uniref:Uncharacterized protein n=1 Tax=Legionella longbeachae serogroup 1 (strain NSW150) TaxID=661367 RepID=D3HPZ2_LEGLN|nr:hypothetical protein LLB_1225 [Legionella longbeachae D-4968]CBJ10957.1 protein of unknown function [Legionella longbeachae NSW150]